MLTYLHLLVCNVRTVPVQRLSFGWIYSFLWQALVVVGKSSFTERSRQSIRPALVLASVRVDYTLFDVCLLDPAVTSRALRVGRALEVSLAT